MARYLNGLEIQMLRPVFKNTLRYEAIVCKANEANIGGAGNSITPAGVAHFSTAVYCRDFATAKTLHQWIFVHEMAHVWQWGHHIWPVNAAIGIFLQTAGAYEKAYPYDLTPGKRLTDFNIEQQASIVADYWALQTRKMAPRNNNNPSATLADYSDVINQLQSSGASVRKLDQVPL